MHCWILPTLIISYNVFGFIVILISCVPKVRNNLIMLYFDPILLTMHFG